MSRYAWLKHSKFTLLKKVYVQVRIQDLAKGEGEVPASEAKSCQCSKVESHKQSKPFVAGVQGPGSFWVFNAKIL